MSSLWRNLSSSLFLLDKSPRRERWEEDLEADMDKEQQSVQECFLGNETFLWWEEQALMEETSFNLCRAQLQLRWYGLRSISMSCIDKLPWKTHRSIISTAPVAILCFSLFLFPSSEYSPSVMMCWNFCMLSEASVYIDIACMGWWYSREKSFVLMHDAPLNTREKVGSSTTQTNVFLKASFSSRILLSEFST